MGICLGTFSRHRRHVIQDKEALDTEHARLKYVKNRAPDRSGPPPADVRSSQPPRRAPTTTMENEQYDKVEVLDGIIERRQSNLAAFQTAASKPKTVVPDATVRIPDSFASIEEYSAVHAKVLSREKVLAFDYHCTQNASDAERRADARIQALRRRDQRRVYDAAPPREGFGGQRHPRFPGDHYLYDRPLIEQTEVLQVARRMPKGAHLHIHFNACLLPDVLLDIAIENSQHMFINSNVPLLPDDDYLNFRHCEIQFSMNPHGVQHPGDLFDPGYERADPAVRGSGRKNMRFADFLDEFPRRYPHQAPRDWLLDKMVFDEREAYHPFQTSHGTWEKFNGRTRLMKGLFNYETAYRRYTRLLLEDFVADNIQYAEIRPNFMQTNQVWTDDGHRIDNVGIMNIIMEEYGKFQASDQGPKFRGLKVIYCAPRSFDDENVIKSLDECIEFKKRWPDWIAGYDLVGEECKGRPLKDFVPLFLDFKRKCYEQDLDIPFLFHCGETLEIGTDTDGNLVDALLLGSRRVGHGFALARHPYVMEMMKKRNICLEVCPISNEILGLTPRIGGHSMYNLLASNVHCTVSSDNGTMFRSTLSHDFYQVMVGKADMTLHGWRQLIEWSIEHACMDEVERADVYSHWEKAWFEFVDWINTTYADVGDE